MIKVAFAATYFDSLIGGIDKKTGQTNNKKSSAAEILDRNQLAWNVYDPLREFQRQ